MNQTNQNKPWTPTYQCQLHQLVRRNAVCSTLSLWMRPKLTFSHSLDTRIHFPMYSITFGMYNIHVSVAEDSLRQRVTICQLQDVADSEAVARWKPVCRRLGVRRDIFAEAEKAGSNDPSEAFVTALESWHDEQGDKATVSVLVEALEKSGSSSTC